MRTRVGAAGLLSAAVLGGAVASVGMLATGTGVESGQALASAALVETGPAGGGSALPGGQAQQDAELLAQPKAVAFLEALRAAEVPTSRNGLAEVLTAKAACAELASGTGEADLARRIPMGLPTVTRKQAATLVDLAREHYC